MQAVKTLLSTFGAKPVAFVVLLEIFARGVLFTGTTAILLPFYRDELHITDSATYQAYSAIALSAWSVGKPIIGLLADSVPLFGFHKRWYLVTFGILGAVMLVVAATVPSPTSDAEVARSVIPFTGALFMATVCVVGIDLLVEGTYSAMIRETKEAGSLLLAVAYGAATFGNISVSLVVGPMADAGYTRAVLLLMAPVSAACAVPAFLNWANEKPAGLNHHHQALPDAADDDDDDQGEEMAEGTGSGMPRSIKNVTKSASKTTECDCLVPYLGAALKRHPSTAAMAIAVGLGAGTVSICIVAASGTVALVVTLTLLMVLTALSLRWLDTTVAKGVLAIVVINASYITIPGAMDYFYLAKPDCVPDGPYFDYTYYQSFTAVITAIASGLGLVLFQRYLVNRSYGSVLVVTSVAQGVASLCDVLIVTRANRHYLGLSDKATYFWGDAVVAPACMMMNFMPSVVLLSRLCPPGVESVMYALLAGMTNFGLTVARILGQQLIAASGIKTSPPCDFSMLPWLTIGTHLVVPLLFLPLAYHLLPPKRMNEDLIDAERVEAIPSDEG